MDCRYIISLRKIDCKGNPTRRLDLIGIQVECDRCQERNRFCHLWEKLCNTNVPHKYLVVCAILEECRPDGRRGGRPDPSSSSNGGAPSGAPFCFLLCEPTFARQSAGGRRRGGCGGAEKVLTSRAGGRRRAVHVDLRQLIFSWIAQRAR